MDARPRRIAERSELAWDLVRQSSLRGMAKVAWLHLAAIADRGGHVTITETELASYLGRGERSGPTALEKLIVGRWAKQILVGGARRA